MAGSGHLNATALMPYVLPKPYSILLDVAAWMLIHAVVGYVVHRLSSSRFASDNVMTRGRRFERDGEVYQQLLRVKRWKAWLPEAGTFFPGGFDKKRLPGAADAGLERYIQETRRAEIVHWITAGTAPFFFVWNPIRAGVVMLAYAAVANGPCIIALRYNRLRLERIVGLRRRARGISDSSGC